MTCLGCARLETGDNLKTLHTGEVVCTYYPDWILECEAIGLLRMPLGHRRKVISEFTDKRSAHAMSELKKRLTSLHNASRGKPK